MESALSLERERSLNSSAGGDSQNLTHEKLEVRRNSMDNEMKTIRLQLEESRHEELELQRRVTSLLKRESALREQLRQVKSAQQEMEHQLEEAHNMEQALLNDHHKLTNDFNTLRLSAQ